MIEAREQGDITILELAHGKANALDSDLCTDIIERIEALRSAGSPAVVITGRGSIFSAGVDLKKLLGGGVDYVRGFLPLLSGAIRALFEYPGPMVAAVNGHAVAGGCIVACTADRRIMVDGGARVGIPELRVGVPFPAAAIEVMRSTLSPERFRGLVYGGATLDSRAAVQWGLVDELSGSESLLDAALSAAKALTRIPAAAFRVTKAQLRLPALQRIDTAEAIVGDHVAALWVEPETLQAVQRHVDRTLNRT
jgi:enoyl-CoA hydratase